MKLLSKAAGYLSGFTWKFWLIGMAGVLTFAGVQTTRLAWEKTGRAQDAVAAEKAKVAAIIAAVEAERHAQAKHEERETERHSHTTELREAAAAAPVGSKTKAVLQSLQRQADEAAREG